MIGIRSVYLYSLRINQRFSISIHHKMDWIKLEQIDIDMIEVFNTKTGASLICKSNKRVYIR